jgi:hypothetical protein
VGAAGGVREGSPLGMTPLGVRMGSPPGPTCGRSGGAETGDGAAAAAGAETGAAACSGFSSAAGNCGMRVAAAAWA